MIEEQHCPFALIFQTVIEMFHWFSHVYAHDKNFRVEYI